MKIILKECKTCPFNDMEYSSCALSYFLDEDKNWSTPYKGIDKNCPLRGISMTFVIEEDQNETV